MLQASSKSPTSKFFTFKKTYAPTGKTFTETVPRCRFSTPSDFKIEIDHWNALGNGLWTYEVVVE